MFGGRVTLRRFSTTGALTHACALLGLVFAQLPFARQQMVLLGHRTQNCVGLNQFDLRRKN